jgi:hypothetical protein
MALLFQYGSNLSVNRINSEKRLCGDAKSLGLAYTFGKYDIGFTSWSTTNGCAAADLIRSRKRIVWGILYEVPDYLLSRETSHQRRSMDAIERPNYRRRKIRIMRKGNRKKILNVWTYTVRNRHKGIKTSKTYADYIINGLIENNAPREYVNHIKDRIVNNNSELHYYYA